MKIEITTLKSGCQLFTRLQIFNLIIYRSYWQPFTLVDLPEKVIYVQITFMAVHVCVTVKRPNLTREGRKGRKVANLSTRRSTIH